MQKSKTNGEKVYATTGFPNDMIIKIDDLAKRQRLSRADVVRQLVSFGLDIAEGAKRK